VTPDGWRGRRVFVTGHTGFKGAWLCLLLRHLGAVVTGYALAPATEPSLFELAGVRDHIRDLRGDVRDRDALTRALRESRPEVVLHLAAQSLVRASYAEPVETLATNVMGTAHLLEASRQTEGVRAVVVVTSDKCYENRERIWGYRESDPMGGFDPYSASKGCAELVTAAWRRSFFASAGDTAPAAVASARAGNVIGGGDWAADRLVPDCVRAFQAGHCVRIRRPEAVRPWQHVLEPLGGYLHLAELLLDGGARFAEGWNFGPREDDARPVRWVVQRAVELWGGDARWEMCGEEHPHEAGWLHLDCSKARVHLGWRPRTDVTQAMDWTIGWYRDVAGGMDAGAACRTQIETFLALGGTDVDET
jgi:CDP-glucose 4,6-dehydratase